ncbi:hypothetical protein Peur_026191 [Populus x canadensis]
MSQLSIESSSWNNDYATHIQLVSIHQNIIEILSEARSLKNAKLQRIYANVNGAITCVNPDKVMRLFQNSVYCLQPTGDSYTRRLIFDSILAGVISKREEVISPIPRILCVDPRSKLKTFKDAF